MLNFSMFFCAISDNPTLFYALVAALGVALAAFVVTLIMMFHYSAKVKKQQTEKETKSMSEDAEKNTVSYENAAENNDGNAAVNVDSKAETVVLDGKDTSENPDTVFNAENSENKTPKAEETPVPENAGIEVKPEGISAENIGENLKETAENIAEPSADLNKAAADDSFKSDKAEKSADISEENIEKESNKESNEDKIDSADSTIEQKEVQADEKSNKKESGGDSPAEVYLNKDRAAIKTRKGAFAENLSDGKDKTFAVKLSESDELTKELHDDILRSFLSHRGIRERQTNFFIGFYFKSCTVGKLSFEKGKLRLNLALSPTSVNPEIYLTRDDTDKKDFGKVPLSVSVASKTALERAERLIAKTVKANGGK